ncbi:MAG: hypothetical protein HYT12_03525 [Candidatus Liptonbacteria bacterium]|nr:hypothetical protein [Candidatus Liptonbacteria bacterium]
MAYFRQWKGLGKNCNIRKYKYKNAVIYKARKTLGLPRHAPYDKILVSAAGDTLPEELLNQLRGGGVMVIPINNSIQKIKRVAQGKYKIKTLCGFAFVPLIKP